MDTLWERIAARAGTDADRPAVTGAQSVGYGRLVQLVEEAAAPLLGYCGPGDVLAIEAPLSLAGLIAILTARRLGAAFMPLDASAPAARRAHQLQSTGARAVLRPDPDDPERLLPEFVTTGSAASASAVPPETAYVIYTSGSTGRPKGVLVAERSLLDRLDAYAERPGFTSDSSFLAMTALTFDPSLAELLLPLCAGGTVVMAPPSARKDPQEFAELLDRHRPDVVQATPTFWRMVLDAGWTGAPGTVLWTGGEALTDQLARQLLPRCRELWNVYGPTEATIWATAWRVEAADPGRPIEVSLGTAVSGGLHLLDAAGAVLTAPGAEGEIVLSGEAVALGYLGDRPEGSRFTALPAIPGPTYLTGDRGRYRADGTLEFLGRLDSQVKLRGHRLELGEVEAALEEHPAVRDAVVLLCGREEAGREHLAAAVATTKPVAERRLRDWLTERLPPYMVPLRIKACPRLPTTTTGKVDRQAVRDLLEGGQNQPGPA